MFIGPRSTTILNLIMAFHWAGDGHCAMALEYRRVLQDCTSCGIIGADPWPNRREDRTATKKGTSFLPMRFRRVL
jgi:hypothetical protein